MTLPTRLVGAIAAAATMASLTIPGVAGANAGDRTFQQTYPLASRLCTEVAAGKRKHLQHFATQVLADCTKLQSGFSAAQSRVLTARAAIAAQAGADHAAIGAACPTPKDVKFACKQTRSQEHDALVALRHQRVRAVHHYYRTIEAGRDAFWRAIHALPGERHLRADAPIVEQDS